MKESKSRFFQTKTHLLGLFVSNNGAEVEPENINEVKKNERSSQY